MIQYDRLFKIEENGIEKLDLDSQNFTYFLESFFSPLVANYQPEFFFLFQCCVLLY